MSTIPNPIAILCDDGQLLTVPEDKNIPQGFNRITWIPTNATVTAIVFDDPNAPYTAPAEQPNGHWTSEGTNDNPGPGPQPWKYTVTATCPGTGSIVLDPQIVNDPPPGDDDEEDKGKGKGKGKGTGQGGG